MTTNLSLGTPITLKRIEVGYLVQRGEATLATIFDHSKATTLPPAYSRVAGRWSVYWASTRIDWHDSFAEACDNARKGP
jgi:hypothetical protein